MDIGASLELLSQYPSEREYLMPPLSCLEVARLGSAPPARRVRGFLPPPGRRGRLLLPVALPHLLPTFPLGWRGDAAARESLQRTVRGEPPPAPRTALTGCGAAQVTGEPRLARAADDREVVVIPMRVNVNLKASAQPSL